VIEELAGESALLTELRGLTEHGRHRAVADRLAALPREEVAARAPFALLAAEAHGRLGEYDAADRWAAAALAVARARGDRHAELRALNDCGAVALERGDGEAAERWFLNALELCREPPAPDPAVQARCFNNLGIIAHLRGSPVAALASYQLALAAYQQAGQPRGLAEAHHNIAISRLQLGDLRGALDAAEQAVRLADQLHDERLAAQALTGRAEMHLQAGDAALAAAELARAEAAYTRLSHPVGLTEVWRLQAGVARAHDALSAATELLQRAAALAREHGSAHTLAEIERDLGAVLAAVGDAAGARAARERAMALYRGLGATDAAARLEALLA
jgi:tetratricopeptide (TPR) repeat protein